MPYLIQGKAKTVFPAFRKAQYVAPGTDKKQVEIDIPRSRFFGSLSQYRDFKSVWLDEQQSPANNYSQGNMTGGNLFLLFAGRAVPIPFFNRDETEEEQIMPQFIKICFGYFDKDNHLRGLSLSYRKDDPTKWIIGISKDPNLPPEETEVKVLTSFDPKPLCKSPCDLRSVSVNDRTLIEAIASPPLEKFIRLILTPTGEINPAAELINLFLPFVHTEDNEQLLEIFNARIAEILTSKLLKLLNDCKTKPSSQQVRKCLDPSSDLYARLSALEVGNENQVELLLLMDRIGLSAERQDLILNDKVLVKKLYRLIPGEHEALLSDYLADAEKTLILSFIIQNDHYEILTPLKETNYQDVCQKFIYLNTFDWQFPKDNFRHEVMCRLLLRYPTISEHTLGQLYETLGDQRTAQVVERVFDPVLLAEYLIQDKNESLCNKQLLELTDFFIPVLHKYEQTAQLGGNTLSKELLSVLANWFVEAKNREFLESLYYCSSAEQLKAALILDELGFERLATYLVNPAVVSAVNLLASCQLESTIRNLLGEEIFLVALGEIHRLNNSEWKTACLILLSQNLLKPIEFAQLIEAFKIYPNLAQQIVAAHEEKFFAEQIKELAFNPDLHQTASFLVSRGVKFSFEQLKQPFACQLILAVANIVRGKKLDDVIKGYLETILPVVLQFVNHEINWEEAQIRLREEKARLIYKRLQESEQDRVLSNLFLGQLQVFAIAKRCEVTPEQQLTKTKYIAKELARALELLTSKLAEDSLLNEEQKNKLYQEVITSFSALEARDHVSAETTIAAIEAFASYHLHGLVDLPFKLLLGNPSLAKAALAIQRHHLPVDSLLHFDEPLQRTVITSLINLGNMAPESQSAFQLAMQDDKEGHDFRLLLTRTTTKNQLHPYLAELLPAGIRSRRISADYANIGKNIENARLRTQAYNLDECLILINRLRALDFDDQFIEFVVRNDEKSRQLYRAILRIEEECQTIRARLKDEAKTDRTTKVKYELLLESEHHYRKDLYQAIYDALNAPKEMPTEQKLEELTVKISSAENHIKNVVEIDRAPELRMAMAIIVNILTLVFTATIANFVHQKNTGDFLFFYRPASSEALNTRHKQVLQEVATTITAAPSD
ncbi:MULTISPECIES: hypothetical protein [Legionella]|uniref:Uncharacterized protein n=1 Tax=Legionella drozanskii LLAP-1 TaxID=1212489 RepID=A0A0W0SN20_9GAMM|nr:MULTISPECIES: hypothetical protein [Legionella]KTC84702.1 hypothetical protein Ldro_2866 [Legionella drozanskii LLAP-1]PJE07540.1 MAG: hypothetical protein CK430_13675 [Legionella sp.]